MVLASQMARPGMGRRLMTSRRRPSKKPWLLAILVLLAVGGGIAFFVLRDDTPASASAEKGSDRSSPAAPAGPALPTPSVAATPSTPAPAPPTLSIGAPRTPPAAAPSAAQPPATAPASAPPSAAAAPPAAVSAPPPSTFLAAAGSQAIGDAQRLITSGKLVEARTALNSMLFDPAAGLTVAQAQAVRVQLADLNERLVFAKEVYPGDPLSEAYTIAQGDYLVRIAPRYKVTSALLEHTNKIADPGKLWVGQKIKVINGPFHVVVTKSAYRMDLFLVDEGKPVYIRSFIVGLGEGDSTPVGAFIVKNRLEDPAWTNPRSGKFYDKADPQNPIGEYWIGLVGANEVTRQFTGYGIHGTVEPDSIGRQASMGCVRMNDADIALVFKLLLEGHSTVDIRP